MKITVELQDSSRENPLAIRKEEVKLENEIIDLFRMHGYNYSEIQVERKGK